MYEPGILFERTKLQKHDMFESWKRSDKQFFAGGACHILAFLFATLHQDEGFKVIHQKPKGDYPGHHMFASNGNWAFDYCGWTLEEELKEVNQAAYRQAYPDWEVDYVEVSGDFTQYLLKTGHRPPEYFPYLPWERAYSYIKEFTPKPPQPINF